MKQVDQDTITLEWCTEDVMQQCPLLTKDQARQVLRRCLEKHDACVGLSWDIIECHADTLFPYRGGDST